MSEEGNEVELDPSLLIEEEPSQEDKSEDQTSEQEPEAPDIPDKYRGKTAAEIIKMHQDAEHLIGRQGNEVGELRKIVDDMLAASAQPSKAPEEPEVDFFENPNAAIASAVKTTLNNDPRLKQLEESAEESKKQAAANALASAHPDYMEVVNSREFGEWVQASPSRLKRFQESHVNFDTETANELITDWKERQSLISSTVENAGKKRNDAVKKAATGSVKASAETRGKPILSREALIELKNTNPDKYYSMMPQIKQAYLEKRVR